MEEILNGYNNIFKMVGENLDDDVRIRNFSYDHYSRLNLSNEDSRKKKEAFDNKIKDYFSRLNDINHQHDTDRDFQNFEYYLRELNEKLIAAGYNEVKSAEDFFNLKKELAKKNNAKNQPQNAQNNNASRSSAVPSGAQNENNNPSRSNSSRTNASRSNTASSNASNGNQSNNTNDQVKKEKSLLKRIFNYRDHNIKGKVSISKVMLALLGGAALIVLSSYIGAVGGIILKIFFSEITSVKFAMFVSFASKIAGGLTLGRAITLSMGKESLIESIGENIKNVIKESRNKRKEKKNAKRLNKAKNKNNRSRNVTPDDLYQNTNSGPTNRNSRPNNTTTNPVTPDDLYQDVQNNPVNRNTNANATNPNPGVSNDQRTSTSNPSGAPTNGTQNTNTGATSPNPGVSNDQRTSTPNPGNSSRNRNAGTSGGSTTNVSKTERLKQLQGDAERIVRVIRKLAHSIQNPEIVANQKKCYSDLRKKVSEMEQLLRETGKINDPEYTVFLQAIGIILENDGNLNYNHDNSRSEDRDQTINMGRSM